MSLKRKTLTALAALTAVSWIGVILVSVTRDGGVSSRLLGLLPTNLVCAVSSYVILLRYDLPFGESWRSVLPQRRLLNSIVAVYVLGVATAISVVGTPGEAIGFLCGFPLFATASFALAYWTMRRIQQRKDRRESRGEASVGSNGRRRPSPSDVGPDLSQKQTLLLIAIAVTISAVAAMGLLRHSPWQAFAMVLARPVERSDCIRLLGSATTMACRLSAPGEGIRCGLPGRYRRCLPHHLDPNGTYRGSPGVGVCHARSESGPPSLLTEEHHSRSPA